MVVSEVPPVILPRVLKCVPAFRDVWPEGAVYIGRQYWLYRLRRSKWANPFLEDRKDKKRDGSRAEIIAKHRAWIVDQPDLLSALYELRGRDLVCWCSPLSCHGDVLLALANFSDKLRRDS
jgi:Domain of unknown function (DUF4326)